MGFAGIMMLVSTAVTAASSYQQGRQQAAVAKGQERMAAYNAQVAEMNARAEREKGRFDQLRHRRAINSRMGRLRAALGGSGARMDVGAPMDVLAMQQAELELDNALVGYNSMVASARSRQQAGLMRFQSKIYGMRASNAMQAGRIGAGTSLLQGMGTMSNAGMFGG
jgi:hypothetical protein